MMKNVCARKIRIKIDKYVLSIFRFLGGVADAAALGSVLSILMKLFPKYVTSIVSWTEMLFGLGYMLGNKIKTGDPIIVHSIHSTGQSKIVKKTLSCWPLKYSPHCILPLRLNEKDGKEVFD